MSSLEGAERLLEGLVEASADGHRLPHRLHLGAQGRVRGGEFLEGEARDLDDNIVERGLEAGIGLARYCVYYLVESIAESDLCRNLSDRIARSL